MPKFVQEEKHVFLEKCGFNTMARVGGRARGGHRSCRLSHPFASLLRASRYIVCVALSLITAHQLPGEYQYGVFPLCAWIGGMDRRFQRRNAFRHHQSRCVRVSARCSRCKPANAPFPRPPQETYDSHAITEDKAWARCIAPLRSCPLFPLCSVFDRVGFQGARVWWCSCPETCVSR